MRKYRFILKHNPVEKSLIDDSEQIFQINKVLRLSSGDYIDGLWENTVFKLKILDSSAKQIKFEIIERINFPEKVPTKIKLFLPILKNADKIELILQKATELGVHEFQFVHFDHSVKQNNNILANKYKRWQKIIEEAVEQSERISIPVLHENIINLKTINISSQNRLSLAFVERIDFKILNLQEKLINLKVSHFDEISLIFGPEGGFSQNEKDFLQQKQFELYSLGNSILRSETAILSGVFLITYLLNALGEVVNHK